MRVFVTSRTSDREDEPEITLYEIDAGRLIDMIEDRLADLRQEDKTRFCSVSCASAFPSWSSATMFEHRSV